MITRDSKKGPKQGKARVTTPKVARQEPDRSGRATTRGAKVKTDPVPEVGADAFGQGSPHEEAHFDEAIASAVKRGYDALAETIGQGRKAAEQFRQGEYNFRQVPGDVEELARRMLGLARQLSGTTFDVCEQLLQQLSTLAEPPEPGATRVEPFRTLRQSGKQEGAAAPKPADKAHSADQLAIAVEFSSKSKASSPTTAIARPKNQTRPEQISASPLAPRSGKGTPLDKVEFSADLAKGGLIAKVTIPPRQAGGIYVGYVVAEGQDEPLGLLVVKLGR